MILPSLLYGAETWNIKTDHLRHMDTFHHGCVRTIFGVSQSDQWTGHISSANLAKRFGMETEVEDLMRAHRLRWLGHLARMDRDKTPKQMLFAEMLPSRPRHGPKLRWRDLAVRQLKEIGIPEAGFVELAQNRAEWRRRCHDIATQLGRKGGCQKNTEIIVIPFRGFRARVHIADLTARCENEITL